MLEKDRISYDLVEEEAIEVAAQHFKIYILKPLIEEFILGFLEGKELQKKKRIFELLFISWDEFFYPGFLESQVSQLSEIKGPRISELDVNCIRRFRAEIDNIILRLMLSIDYNSELAEARQAAVEEYLCDGQVLMKEEVEKMVVFELEEYLKDLEAQGLEFEEVSPKTSRDLLSWIEVVEEEPQGKINQSFLRKYGDFDGLDAYKNSNNENKNPLKPKMESQAMIIKKLGEKKDKEHREEMAKVEKQWKQMEEKLKQMNSKDEKERRKLRKLQEQQRIKLEILSEKLAQDKILSELEDDKIEREARWREPPSFHELKTRIYEENKKNNSVKYLNDSSKDLELFFDNMHLEEDQILEKHPILHNFI